MKYTILMNGRNFINNSFNTFGDCKQRINTCKSIFKHSTFFVVVNELTYKPI